MIRELIVPFLIGTVAVVLMFQVNTYIWAAKALNLDNVPLTAVFQYILYQTPGYLKMTLPVGMALAASLTMTRLARESELTAMRANGVGILRVITPIAVFGVVVALLNFYLVEKIIPISTRKANQIAQQIAIVGFGASTFKSNAFLELSKFSASFGSVQKGPKETLIISDVMLIERPEPGALALTTAKTASYDQGVWTFKDAYYYRVKGEDLTIARPKGDFIVNEKIVIDQIFNSLVPEEQSAEQLSKAIATGRKLRQDTRKQEVEFHTRFSWPAACAVFALVAPVFAVMFSRSGGFTGVLISIVMVGLYYNAFVISTEILGKIDFVPSWVAAWLPNILFATVGVWAIRRIE